MTVASYGLGALLESKYRGPPVDAPERPFYKLYSNRELASFMEMSAGMMLGVLQRAPMDMPALMKHLPVGGDPHSRQPSEQYLLRQLFLYLMKPWLGVFKLAEISKVSRSTVDRAHAEVTAWLASRPALREMAESLAYMIEGVPSVMLQRDEGLSDMRIAYDERRHQQAQIATEKRERLKKRRSAVMPGQEEAAAMLVLGRPIREVSDKTGIEFRAVAELFCRLQATGDMVAIREEAKQRLARGKDASETQLRAVVACL